MYLRADQPEATQIAVCLLDGKPVPECYEANEEEGWVTSWIPDLPSSMPANGEPLDEDNELQRAGFKLIKRTGKVQLIFKNQIQELRKLK